jgi:hypothetical protein
MIRARSPSASLRAGSHPAEMHRIFRDDCEYFMEKRIRFVKHEGQLIMLIDLSHCTPAEIMPLADEIQRRVAEHPLNSLLTLADFTGVQIDKVAAMRIKEVLTLDRPYVKRSAWVGTESLPHVFYENFKSFSQRDLPTFKTREDAMDWLVKE